MAAKRIALICKLSRGGFSGERSIEVATIDGMYRGLAPTHLCWTADGQPLDGNVPAEGETIDGLVAARQLQVNDQNQQVVSIPDGSSFAVPSEILATRPGIRSDVFV